MKDERGQVMVLVIGLGLLAFAVAGLAVDGTRAFLLRRTLQNAADAAALAGAGELDQETLYRSGGRSVRLDPAAARSRAIGYLSQRGLPAEASVAAGMDAVRIVLRARMDTTFLGIVGIGQVPVAADSTAEPLPRGP